MLSKQIEVNYTDKIDNFEARYSGLDYIVETMDLKITMNRYSFEELRNKLNKLYDEVN